MSKSLPPRQLRALPYFASAPSVSAGADRAKIARRTFERWMKDPSFRGEVERLRGEAAALAQTEFEGLLLQSVLTLTDAMNSPNESVRVAAARSAASIFLRIREDKELHKRLDTLDGALSVLRAQLSRP